MDHPYRVVAGPRAGRGGDADPEALAIYGVLALVGSARLIVAVALAEVFAAEATIALAMVVLATCGALARVRVRSG